MSKIRQKLLDFKQRLSDRHMYSIVLVVIGAISIWGFYNYKRSMEFRQELDNQYNRAFLDMVGYVDNVEVLLAKSLISSSPVRTSATLQEAWRQANLAQTNLGQLPVSQPVLAKTSKFLIQLGDFAYAMNTQNMKGKTLDENQYEAIQKLHGYAVSLRKNLAVLQDQLTSGRIKWGMIADKGTKLFSKQSAKATLEQFENIDKTFQQYPTLIYDGPYSDHMVSAKPRGLGDKKVSVEEAKKIAEDFIGKDRLISIEHVGNNEAGKIKTYSFRIALKSDRGSAVDSKQNKESSGAFIDISQMGGHPYWMLYNRYVPAQVIKMDKAREIGKKFLDQKGFKNMKDTYYMAEGNIATINYAYSQNGVTMYPDLIKVKIALDNGEIIGFEAKGYLNAHIERNIPAPGISAEEARKKINPRVKVESEGLVYIPTNYNSEIFCYEFKGKLNDRDFLIYINALTGEEEDILMIIHAPNGVLTM